PAGHRHAHRRLRAGDHGDPVHLIGHARGVPDRADATQGIGLRARLHQVGSELGHHPALYPLGGDRRHLPGPGPRTGRDHGGGVRGRQLGAAVRLAAGAGHHHRRADRQRFRRGYRNLSLRAAAAGLRAVRRDLRGAGDRTLHADAALAQGGQLMSIATPHELAVADRLYARRRFGNALAIVLAVLAAAFGLFFLGWILWTLFTKAVGGLNWALFTQMTPPPMQEGGLLNAFFGSAVMCAMAIGIGTPLGVAAGTWLSEYGRARKAGTVVRFVN